MRGGMNISFAGKGIIVVFMTFIPMFTEASTIALIGLKVFNMPIEVSYSMGFAMASVAPAIVVPKLMRWDSEGYGRSKGISGTLIAACTFDLIPCLILFGICKTIAFQYAAENIDGSAKHNNTAWAIGSIFVHNVSGIIAGLIIGLCGWFFKFIDHKSYAIILKCIFSLLASIGLIIASELSNFQNAKFIACVSFGYTCFRVWGDKKPTK
jgi:NhaP-type Na+/H+ or K+/H+ antiporter